MSSVLLPAMYSSDTVRTPNGTPGILTLRIYDTLRYEILQILALIQSEWTLKRWDRKKAWVAKPNSLRKNA